MGYGGVGEGELQGDGGGDLVSGIDRALLGLLGEGRGVVDSARGEDGILGGEGVHGARGAGPLLSKGCCAVCFVCVS